MTAHLSVIQHAATRIAELLRPEVNGFVSDERLNNHSAGPDSIVWPHTHHVSHQEPDSRNIGLLFITVRL